MLPVQFLCLIGPKLRGHRDSSLSVSTNNITGLIVKPPNLKTLLPGTATIRISLFLPSVLLNIILLFFTAFLHSKLQVIKHLKCTILQNSKTTVTITMQYYKCASL
jgi:hypothetical protein